MLGLRRFFLLFDSISMLALCEIWIISANLQTKQASVSSLSSWYKEFFQANFTEIVYTYSQLFETNLWSLRKEFSEVSYKTIKRLKITLNFLQKKTQYLMTSFSSFPLAYSTVSGKSLNNQLLQTWKFYQLIWYNLELIPHFKLY